VQTQPIPVQVARHLEKNRRQASLDDVPGWNAGRLHDARVVVAGAGALGAEVARQLALSGVGRLLIADALGVTIEDIGSSGMFRAEDVGMPRAHLVRSRLGALCPDLRAHAIAESPLSLGSGVVRNADLLIAADCVPRARLALDRWCRKTGRAWIDASSGVYHGQFRVVRAATGACLECGMPDGVRKALTTALPAAVGTAPLAVPTTIAVVAGLIAQIALRLLCPVDGLPDVTGREYLFNGHTTQVTAQLLIRRADCDHPDPPAVLEGPWSGETRLIELLDAARKALGADAALELDRPIAWKLTCDRCETSQATFRSALLLAEHELACRGCGVMRKAETLRHVAGKAPFLAMPVKALGLPPLPLFVARSSRGAILLEPTGDRPAALGVTA
jgi:adenylyltransferase/sulfurtransferase